MSVIQKIRDKYSKIAGGVIAIALVGFILSDAASGSLGKLFGNDNSLAQVNGEKVEPQEFAQRISEYETLYAMNSQNATIDDNTRVQIREQALRDLINEKIIASQIEKLGLTSSEDEDKATIYGSNPDQMIRQYPIFTNPETGQFDPNRVKQYESQIMQIDPTGAEKAKWETYKNFVKRNHTMQKYYNLLNAGAYIPNFQIAATQKEQGQLASFSYVKVPFTTVNDNEVKVTDADLQDYLKKKSKLYTIDQPTRSIEYVTFDVVPSKEDTIRTQAQMQELKEGFISTTDAESYVNRNSDNPYKGNFYNKQSFGSVYADSILGLPIGSVYGPYLDNGFYTMVKVQDRSTLPDSVNAKHILITTQQGKPDTVAKATADSLLNAIKAGANFDSLAMQFSDDPGSKTQGGDLGFFTKGQMVKEFDSVSFFGKTGDLTVVKTQFGYHVIKVNEQKSFNPATKLAIIAKALYPSETTENAVFAKANEFAGKYSNSKGFEDGVKAMNLTKKKADNVKINDFMIQGIGPARDIIRWMYDAEPQEVSGVINMKDKYVITKLSAVQEPGLIALDDNTRPMIESAVKAEKKAAIIKAKFKSSNSLQAISQAAAQPIQQADSVSLQGGFIPGIGYELKVVGYAFNPKFAPNTLSPGISGADGVYYITVANRINRPQDPNAEMMIRSQKAMMEGQLRQNYAGMAVEAMRSKAKIKYNSKNLY